MLAIVETDKSVGEQLHATSNDKTLRLNLPKMSKTHSKVFASCRI